VPSRGAFYYSGGSWKLTVLSRYLTHAVVLVIVVTISGYATVGRHFQSGFNSSSVDANALVMNEGGQISEVYLGRFSTIVKPLAIPSSAVPSHSVISYTVSDGDTVASVAQKFNISVDQLRWSNPLIYDWVGAGQHLNIPPVAGVVYAAGKGDTMDSIASSYHVDADVIVEYNRVTEVTPGMLLVIPNGVGPEFKPIQYGRPIVSRAYDTPGSYSNGRFPWGYCTWYVASKRPVPWIGNAYQWPDNARAMGYQTGMTPKPGAIMATWESSLGHVAYVEAVNADGSWTVSEMNFVGFGVVSRRTIKPGQVPLIAFIY